MTVSYYDMMDRMYGGEIVMRQKKIRSAGPVYFAAGVWALYALLFPLYRILDFIVCFLLSLLGYALSQKLFFKPKVIEITKRPENAKPAEPLPQKPGYGPEIDAIIAEGNLAHDNREYSERPDKTRGQF